MLDHKELLKKYIKHVGVSEGTTFLNDWNRRFYEPFTMFTNEEWEELKQLDQEVFPNLKKR